MFIAKLSLGLTEGRIPPLVSSARAACHDENVDDTTDVERAALLQYNSKNDASPFCFLANSQMKRSGRPHAGRVLCVPACVLVKQCVTAEEVHVWVVSLVHIVSEKHRLQIAYAAVNISDKFCCRARRMELASRV